MAVHLAGQQLAVIVISVTAAFLLFQQLPIAAGILGNVPLHPPLEECFHQIGSLDRFVLLQGLLGKEFIEQLERIGDYIVQPQFVIGCCGAKHGGEGMGLFQRRILKIRGISEDVVR